jgi:CheY-like chemotaxis protein/HPt (histidine-containing phosphotransfer) domain-containing protein
MGGRMWVESVVGLGTTFSFTLLAEAAPNQPRTYLHGRAPQLAGKRLLIVDDNATNRRILQLQAESWGMQVQSQPGGAAALAWLDQGPACDLAVLDMQMPEMDGVQLAAAIRRRRSAQELPLVLLTSLGRRQEDLASGHFAACLTKPVKAAQLYEALCSVVGGGAGAPAASVAPRAGLDTHMAERLPLRILLAEDNAINQKVALRTLERLGYRTDVAGNGLEVLTALDRQPYDVVLMDMQMPEMDGLEATRLLRERLPGARQPWIIAMTANAMQSDRELCLQAGMNDYVSKPVPVADLIAALERAGARPLVAQTPAGMVGGGQQADTLVDRSVLATLAEHLGDETIVTEIVELFLSDAPGLLEQWRQATASGDGEAARRATHTLKGTSASIGAVGLARCCADAEALAREDRLEDAAQLITCAVDMLAQTEALLR